MVRLCVFVKLLLRIITATLLRSSNPTAWKFSPKGVLICTRETWKYNKKQNPWQDKVETCSTLPALPVSKGVSIPQANSLATQGRQEESPLWLLRTWANPMLTGISDLQKWTWEILTSIQCPNLPLQESCESDSPKGTWSWSRSSHLLHLQRPWQFPTRAYKTN